MCTQQISDIAVESFLIYSSGIEVIHFCRIGNCCWNIFLYTSVSAFSVILLVVQLTELAHFSPEMK